MVLNIFYRQVTFSFLQDKVSGQQWSLTAEMATSALFLLQKMHNVIFTFLNNSYAECMVSLGCHSDWTCINEMQANGYCCEEFSLFTRSKTHPKCFQNLPGERTWKRRGFAFFPFACLSACLKASASLVPLPLQHVFTVIRSSLFRPLAWVHHC